MNRRDALRLGLAGTTALIGNATIGGVAFAQDTAEPIVIDDKFLGAEDAPVTVIEYASFTCPHCARFHEEVFPQIKENYIDTGKVKFVYREVYFDRPGLWAALVARCGGEMRYFGIVDMLFQKQRDWIGDGQGPTIAANLRGIGLASGLTDAEMDVCLTDGAGAQALIDRYEGTMEEYDITGTPTLIVNGEKVTPASFEALSEAVDAALES